MPMYEVTFDTNEARCTTRQEAGDAYQAVLLAWMELEEPVHVSRVEAREVAE